MTTEKHSQSLPNESRSEVARLMQQIDQEYEAAERGLKGLSSGTAIHHFITKRMENIAVYHQTLLEAVGEKERHASS